MCKLGRGELARPGPGSRESYVDAVARWLQHQETVGASRASWSAGTHVLNRGGQGVPGPAERVIGREVRQTMARSAAQPWRRMFRQARPMATAGQNNALM